MRNPYLNWPLYFKEAKKLEVPTVNDDVYCFGMGGSGIVCELMEPFFPFSDYKHAKTVIAVSYSGNTVETLLMAKRAMMDGKKVIAVTSGGNLQKQANETVKLPDGLVPRYALPYLFTPVLKMLVPSLVNEIPESILMETVSTIALNMRLHLQENSLPGLPYRIPVFYGSKWYGLARRFKTDINENSKYPAFSGRITEIYHNEIEGLKYDRVLAPIVFTDGDDIDSIFPVNAYVYTVSNITQMIIYLYVAGVLSIDMAIRLGENFVETPLIDTVKKVMSDRRYIS